jgi:uncharacterized membrane protein YhaH (DUF805 family)
MRKVIIILMLLCYLMAFPPFMSIYNRPGFVLGIPTFMFGLFCISACLILLVYILYRYEDKQNREN